MSAPDNISPARKLKNEFMEQFTFPFLLAIVGCLFTINSDVYNQYVGYWYSINKPLFNTTELYCMSKDVKSDNKRTNYIFVLDISLSTNKDVITPSWYKPERDSLIQYVNGLSSRSTRNELLSALDTLPLELNQTNQFYLSKFKTAYYLYELSKFDFNFCVWELGTEAFERYPESGYHFPANKFCCETDPDTINKAIIAFRGINQKIDGAFTNYIQLFEKLYTQTDRSEEYVVILLSDMIHESPHEKTDSIKILKDNYFENKKRLIQSILQLADKNVITNILALEFHNPKAMDIKTAADSLHYELTHIDIKEYLKDIFGVDRFMLVNVDNDNNELLRKNILAKRILRFTYNNYNSIQDSVYIKPDQQGLYKIGLLQENDYESYSSAYYCQKIDDANNPTSEIKKLSNYYMRDINIDKGEKIKIIYNGSYHINRTLPYIRIIKTDDYKTAAIFKVEFIKITSRWYATIMLLAIALTVVYTFYKIFIIFPRYVALAIIGLAATIALIFQAIA